MQDQVPFYWPTYPTQYDFIENVYAPGNSHAKNRNGRTRDKGFFFNKLEMQLSLKYRKPYNANTILESDFATNGINPKYI